MSMLVKDIETFKKHVTVTASFTIEAILPYIRQQERKHIKSVVGRSLYAVIGSASEGVRKEVLELLQEASSNLAMLSYTMTGSLAISKSGITKTQSQDVVSASYGDLKDLRRDLLKKGSEAIDEALELMEENEGDFEEWINSSGHTNFKELFTRKTQDFQRFYNIENSRLTFLRLRPHLLKVEKKYFRGLLGMETVSQIKAGTKPEEKEALELCQSAQVPLCVSEIAREGASLLTSKGMFYEIDELPGEKKIKLEQDQLDRLYDAKQEEGTEQLSSLVSHLRNYPEIFSHFTQKESETAEITRTTKNTQSIVSF